MWTPPSEKHPETSLNSCAQEWIMKGQGVNPCVYKVKHSWPRDDIFTRGIHFETTTVKTQHLGLSCHSLDYI